MKITLIEDTQGASMAQGESTLQGSTTPEGEGLPRIGLARCELVEVTKRGNYSRLADEVRRVIQHIRHIERITISQNAPAWRRAASIKINSPDGLTTILSLDYKGVREVHYKTATGGHKAKVFVITESEGKPDQLEQRASGTSDLQPDPHTQPE